MTVIEWDKVGERFYQTGVDRGVLYLPDGAVVAWNGITGVEENSNSEIKSYYLDGVKFLEHVTPGDFSGKLKAFTYPEEFDQVMGIAHAISGLSIYEQPSKSFSLSYRTKIGNDMSGIDHGYKIHLLYNLLAVPDVKSFNTVSDSVDAIEFAWELSGTPVAINDYRPAVHISIDSSKTPPEIIEEIEAILYGTESEDPRLPSIFEVRSIFGDIGTLTITDNGDGTWTASELGDDYITMINSTTFQINNADVVYLDDDTYEISSTNV